MLCFDSEKMNWYYHVLARRPYLVVVSIAVYCVACIIVALILNKLPDFSDPSLVHRTYIYFDTLYLLYHPFQGFETRGTKIGKRLTSWYNLLQETDHHGALFSNPSDLWEKRRMEQGLGESRQHPRRHRNKHKNRGKNKRRKEQNQSNHEHHDAVTQKMMQFKKRLKATSDPPADLDRDTWMGDSGVFRDYEITNDSASSSSLEPTRRTEPIEYGHNTTSVDEEEHRERVQTKKSTWRLLKQAATLPTDSWVDTRRRQPIEGFFCDSSPRKEYSHFVVQRIGPNATDSLFDLNGLLAMCQLQDQITEVSSYRAFCEPEMLTGECCRPWSLPNYAAMLANKSSCFDLTVEDVTSLQALLTGCYEYFHDLKMDNHCNEIPHCRAPEECKRHNIVFNVLNFLTDFNFMKSNVSR